MSEIKITSQNYENEVLKSCKPVLLAPVLSDIAKEYESTITVGKVDVDHESSLATKHQIASIPTLLVLKDGLVVNRIVGFQSKEEIKKLLNKVL